MSTAEQLHELVAEEPGSTIEQADMFLSQLHMLVQSQFADRERRSYVVTMYKCWLAMHT